MQQKSEVILLEVLIPILYMGKLRHRVSRHLPSATQLCLAEVGFRPRQAGSQVCAPKFFTIQPLPLLSG